MMQPTIRRLGLPAIVTIAALAALTAVPAHVSAKKSSSSENWAAPREAGEPVMAIVSIKSQNITFYDADGWVYRAPVSTGVKGRETPAGVFAVLEKEREHYSTLYDDASMPHMQRLTWNGIAFHGGPLPGYAASHGCVRMPYGFARDVFDKTHVGMRVIISPDDAEPVAFSHPALLVPDAAAVVAAPGRAETLEREAAEAAKAADETKKAAKQAARDAKSSAAALRKAERRKSGADEDLADAVKALEKAHAGVAKAEERKLKAAAKAAEAAANLDAAKSGAESGAESGADASGKTAAKPADTRKLERQKSAADEDLADADKAIERAKSGVVKAEERRLKAAAKATEAGATFDTAKADATAKKDAAAKAEEAAKAAAARKEETAKAAGDAKLALEPASIYISRATKKLYVRRNTQKAWSDGGVVYDTSIEVPVTIRDPDRPIGTHIFTAMANESDGDLRWSAVTIDGGDDARNALDRVSIPQEVLDRIAPTALPRSSIVVSDEPLSRETNYRTEFVAVLSNHPQGGFKTRRPTVAPVKPVWESGGFFSFFGQPQDPQPRDDRRRRRRHQGKPGMWW